MAMLARGGVAGGTGLRTGPIARALDRLPARLSASHKAPRRLHEIPHAERGISNHGIDLHQIRSDFDDVIVACLGPRG